MTDSTHSKTSKWFVVQVMSGSEKKVKKTMEENFDSSGMRDVVQEVLIPVENVAEVKQGEQKIREKVLWPGYILVKMDLSEESWQFIKNTNGVIDFLGGGQPSPLTDKEVDAILSELVTKKGEVVHKYNIQVGDVVKIVDGVFINFTGTVTEIFQDKGRLSVLVSIFGRDTRVNDLEVWQIEKVVND